MISESSLKPKEPTLRELEWDSFSRIVGNHIRDYAVPKHGDVLEDKASAWTIDQSLRRVWGRSRSLSKAGKGCAAAVEIMKLAHEACIAYNKIVNAVATPGGEAESIRLGTPSDPVKLGRDDFRAQSEDVKPATTLKEELLGHKATEVYGPDTPKVVMWSTPSGPNPFYERCKTMSEHADMPKPELYTYTVHYVVGHPGQLQPAQANVKATGYRVEQGGTLSLFGEDGSRVCSFPPGYWARIDRETTAIVKLVEELVERINESDRRPACSGEDEALLEDLKSAVRAIDAHMEQGGLI